SSSALKCSCVANACSNTRRRWPVSLSSRERKDSSKRRTISSWRTGQRPGWTTAAQRASALTVAATRARATAREAWAREAALGRPWTAALGAGLGAVVVAARRDGLLDADVAPAELAVVADLVEGLQRARTRLVDVRAQRRDAQDAPAGRDHVAARRAR